MDNRGSVERNTLFPHLLLEQGLLLFCGAVRKVHGLSVGVCRPLLIFRYFKMTIDTTVPAFENKLVL